MDNINPIKKKLLIVEDDFYIRDLYEAEAKNRGFEVSTAADGEEAITKVKFDTPDLILLDLMLPKVDGVTVLRAVKTDPKTMNIPVVIITNLSDPNTEQETKDTGAAEYLLKVQHSPKEIIDRLNQYIH